MKREDILAILNDAEKSAEEKRDAILALNGEDIAREKSKTTQAEDRIKALEGELATERDNGKKYADYDQIVAERDGLLTEKAERETEQRFKTVLGDSRPKNEYTRAGLYAAFKEALKAEDNKDKTDADIFNGIVGDKHADLFHDNVSISMHGVNTQVSANTDELRQYLDDKYKNNPFYTPQN